MKFNTFVPKTQAEGKYNAVIDTVEPTEGQYGPQLKLTFILQDTVANENFSVIEWVKPQISAKYPMFGDLLALVGITDKEGELDETKLVGRECVVDTLLKPGKDGMNYLRIQRISKK